MSDQERKPNGQYQPKRYVGHGETITVEMTDFECMFVAQRLWEASTMYDNLGKTTVEEECKYWSRKFHSERKTRDNNE